MTERKNLRVERRDDGVAVLWIDTADEKVNSLRADLTSEVTEVFDGLERDAGLKGVVLTSAKDDFIVGADVKMLEKIKTAREGAAISRGGHATMERLETFRVPVVAAIHGACLGGGMEIALACAGRVASGDRRTKLGLPESQLGLLPGAGGTQRMPRLIGTQAALDLMLTGKHVTAKKSKKLGLVDEVVPQPILIDVAARLALKIAAGEGPKREAGFDREALTEAALAKNPLGRAVLFDQAKKQLLAKTKGNYPAQEKILEVVRAGLAGGFEKGLEAEAEAFGELTVSSQAEQLIGIFRATTAMKKETGVDDPTITPKEIPRLGMLGAGLMGAGIAYVTAHKAGIPVRLKDRDPEGVGRGLAYVGKILDKRVKRRRMTKVERDVVMSKVGGTTSYDGFERLPLVIEAVFEDLALKHRVLRDVEEAGPRDVIFASNTSSIPITQIAEGSAHPETVIGMHYFSPVEKMPLLEIIVTDKTADWVTATCVEIGKKQGKTVIVVNDGVGFYTSRILGPLMSEAAFILNEGVPIHHIDRALVQWGFPVGPITLLDEVGIDVAHKVGKVVRGAFGDRLSAPPGFDKLVDDNRFGRKNNRGFFKYENGKKQGKGRDAVDESVYRVLGIDPSKELPEEDIAQRCALMFVNEAAHCYGEGILRNARDGDIGAVFGLGFPPFRGGPFRYIDTVGPKEIVRRLSRFRDRLGNRFAPAPVLVDMAKSGKTFHGGDVMAPGQHPREREAAKAAE